MQKSAISSKNAPNAIGPYSAGMEVTGVQNFYFFSGQIALPPGENPPGLVGKTAAEQMQQIAKNISALLEEKDLNFANIVKTTIFLKSMDDFRSVNEIYAKLFSENPPARSTIEVSKLPLDALVEIECIAAK